MDQTTLPEQGHLFSFGTTKKRDKAKGHALKHVTPSHSHPDFPFQEEMSKNPQVRREEIKRIIEALLFAAQEPIPFQKIKEIIETTHEVKALEISSAIHALKYDYERHSSSFRIEEIAHGFIVRTKPEFSRYIDMLYRNRRGEKLSGASTEVLAIIAHKQPITRPEIEAIRGVDSSGVIHQLLERNLIEGVGKLEAPGRPTLYGTTREFLKHFGLKDLSDLKKALTI